MQRINTSGVAALTPKARTQANQGKRFTPQQRLALAVGGVGCFLLFLSVWDCTLALNRLTGMPCVLAALMAVGIDVGMVVSEMAAVATPDKSKAHVWAEWYVHLAVVLSVCLNATTAAGHAEGWAIAAAIPVGGIVPVFVYIAGRTAGSLWTRK